MTIHQNGLCVFVSAVQIGNVLLLLHYTMRWAVHNAQIFATGLAKIYQPHPFGLAWHENVGRLYNYGLASFHSWEWLDIKECDAQGS